MAFTPLYSQSCYQNFFVKGKNAFEALEFEDAIAQFDAARACPGLSLQQQQEITDWLDRAKSGYIDAITKAKNDAERAKSEAEKAQKEAEQQARVSEANRLAFLANQEAEQGNKSDALALAFAGMRLIEEAPIPSVKRAFGDAAFLNYANSLQDP